VPLDAAQLLRPGLLEGTSVIVVGACAPGGTDARAGGAGSSSAGLAQTSLGAAVERGSASLGARARSCATPAALHADADAETVEEEVGAGIARALAGDARVDALVVDADGLFAAPAAAPEPAAGLRVCLLVSWSAARSLAVRTFIGPAAGAPPGQGDGEGPAEGDSGRGPAGGRIVLLAPRADGRPHAAAATAGLENVARTLSIEWARYAITTVAVAPGAATPASEVAALTAYLLSPAGAYFSGCLLDLRGEPARERSP
jgi:NAD(P)-dependent dehydrogenase (short-subunit alcohol dehydrogenase family)